MFELSKEELESIAIDEVSKIVDRDIAQMIVNESKKSIPSLISEFIACLNKKDLIEATRCIHSIKGVMATLGLSEISETARSIEYSLKDENIDIDNDFKKIKSFADKFCQ